MSILNPLPVNIYIFTEDSLPMVLKTRFCDGIGKLNLPDVYLDGRDLKLYRIYNYAFIFKN
jgi:hypothetical protein